MRRSLLAVLAAVLTIGLIGGYLMAHGTPDWYGSGPTTTVHQVKDLGELAVRLGSPVSYDRRGNVVWAEDFADGAAAWSLDGSGTGHSEVLSAARAYSPPYSVHLTAGSDGTMQANVLRRTPVQVLGKIGLEAAWNVGAAPVYVQVQLSYYDGSYAHVFRVRWNSVDNDLEYMDQDQAWQDLDDDYHVQVESAAWNILKVVGDPSTDEYVRVLAGKDTYVLEGVPCWVPASATYPSVFSGVVVYTTAGNNGHAYVDDIILTQNEP